jgi:hypothetical protein
MFSLKNKYLIKIVILMTLFSMQVPLAYDSLNYQDRGNRYEGIAPRPVSGSDIELLSALVDHRETWKPIPSNGKLKFYLPSAMGVDIKVQELRPKHFYKMDRVLPKPPWQRGFNDFQWFTRDVIAPLNLKMVTLGIVARLKKITNNDAEHVAPVVFYHATLPKAINGYLFTFKVGGSAELQYAVYQGKNQTPIVEDDLGEQSVGEPFVIYWDSHGAQAGNYELIVAGYFLDDFMPIHQSVHFYHQPTMVVKNH